MNTLCLSLNVRVQYSFYISLTFTLFFLCFQVRVYKNLYFWMALCLRMKVNTFQQVVPLYLKKKKSYTMLSFAIFMIIIFV